MNHAHTLVRKPQPADAAGIVSWVHIGDLHITTAEQPNHRDLHVIVDEINQAFARHISFVYLPGDNADHARPEEYALVSGAVAKLTVPWFAIVGDHDVHGGTLAPYFAAFGVASPTFSFRLAGYTFVGLDAFQPLRPDAFDLGEEQLHWFASQLKQAAECGDRVIVFLHCYPSDLKQRATEVSALVRQQHVLLVDTGHTHYNEISNDGQTLYTATRSTGQIEEGPAGYSITNIDGDVVSWRFKPLGEWPLAVITTPADARMIPNCAAAAQIVSPGKVPIRAKVWSPAEIESVEFRVHGASLSATRLTASAVWQAEWNAAALAPGKYELTVSARDSEGRTAKDSIQLLLGSASNHTLPERLERDQDNYIQGWPEHGILGTQLGPNKNGKKW